VESDDPDIVSSLDPIFGGPGWRSRFDTTLPRGEAVLKLFRETLKVAGNFEYVVATKVGAKSRKQEAKSGLKDLFTEHEAGVQAESIEEIASSDMKRARPEIVEMLHRHGVLEFTKIAGPLMEKYMLREPNVKDLLVELARDGLVENTWGGGNRKPKEHDSIHLKTASP
jgi:hypothetical protein